MRYLKRTAGVCVSLLCIGLNIACTDPADSVPEAKTPVQAKQRIKPDAVKPESPSVKVTSTKTSVQKTVAQKTALTPPKKLPSDAQKPNNGSRPLSGTIVFIGSKVTGSHECLFEKWTGTARIPEDDLTKASFQFSVETASVVVDYKKPKLWSKKLASHLKSHDFFHSQAAPTAEFVSESVTKGGMNGQGTHVITGQMTIRNTTRQIIFPATLSMENGQFKAHAEFSIRRKRFNIIYPGKPDDLIRDRVVLKLDFKG